MMGYGACPMMSADDITDPAHTVDYELAFLPGSDAFHTFQGYLGERRLLPGRDGCRVRVTAPCPGSSRCRRRFSAAAGAS